MSNTSRQYLEAIASLLADIECKEEKSIDKAALILAEAVGQNKLINIIGSGGHSNIAAEEIFWRAGSLAPVNAILDAGINLIHGAKRSNIVERTPGYAAAVLDSYRIGEGDVLIIVNAYGINPLTVDCALECKKRGITTIGITSASFAGFVPKDSPSRHSSGLNLYEQVDVFIDNHLPLGDSVIKLEGIEQKMGSTSTFVNIFAVNLLMMRTAEKMRDMGLEPPVWVSANMPGGDKLNKRYEEQYMPRIKHL